ncbi:MAG TPA: hypothetical protein VES03_08860 [Motilibacterales bacterium]|nr:hypothetical protein [Motilibacterales bacterium]
MPTRPEALPDGTILFHGGFHKTGTTAVQSALASTRPTMLDNGVLYPGDLRSHHRAAMAVTGRTWGWGTKGGRPPRETYWSDLYTQVQAHPGRVVISSEAFSLAQEGALDRIMSDLGADRLHAVFTLRPFARLLSSSYQQYLKYGLSVPYGTWLDEVFAAPPACPPSPNFWRRNDHAGVIGRWADLLGPDRVTLLVLDESDRGGLFRTFESLLGLPDGLLVPDPAISAGNRSMTAAEAEMLRLVNAGGASGWEWPAYQDGVRRGAVMRMVESRTPSPGEPALATPEWAVRAAQAFGQETAHRVQALGVRVIGDISRLADAIPAADPPSGGILLPVDAAAEAVLGGILGATARLEAEREAAMVRWQAQSESATRAAARAATNLTTRQAAALLRRQLDEARRRRLRRARGALTGGSSRPRTGPEAPE